MTMDQTLTGASASSPLLNALATAAHVSAAGAGNWSVPMSAGLFDKAERQTR